VKALTLAVIAVIIAVIAAALAGCAPTVTRLPGLTVISEASDCHGREGWWTPGYLGQPATICTTEAVGPVMLHELDHHQRHINNMRQNHE